MSNSRPYEEIPVVSLPDDYQLHLAPLLAQAYAEHGPIFRSTFFGKEILYLVGPEANRFVLVSNRQKFSNYVGWNNIFGLVSMFGRGLLSMDGEEHTSNRKMMNPAFTVSYMDRYLPLMQRIIREHVATWVDAGEVDLYEEMRKITFAVAAEALTGLQAGAEVERFRELFVSMLLAPAMSTSQEDFQERIQQLHAELYTLMKPKIEERRQHPTHDIFGMLVQARDEHGQAMSDEQLIAHINILLVAGHETSTSLSSWLFYLLTQHPEYTQRILTEQAQILGARMEPALEDIKQMKVLDNALSEAERLFPPVPNGPRGVVEDFDFNDYHVPAGTFAFYSIAASHLLPHLFANPELFDPDRFAPPREEQKKHPYALVGFGGGPRICIGINFAQVEIKAMVSHVLRNYKLELIPNQEIVQVYGATGAPMHGIRVRVSALEHAL